VPNRRRTRPTHRPLPTSFGDIAPALATITDEILFGELWERPGLGKRDRSLVTISSLISLYRSNELPFHVKRALIWPLTRDGRRR
jgi:4-carboxymuconolactone decarboxylase